MSSKKPASQGAAGRIGPGCTLRGAKLDGLELPGADLSAARLARVSMRGANLRGARFVGAVLDQVDLRGAQLEGADLRGAQLERVELDGARVDELDARGASFTQCGLGAVRGQGLDLTGARLLGVSLAGAELSNLSLDGAVLEDVGLADLSIRGASLVGARATGCVIIRCLLAECDLRGATLDGLNLRESRLEGCTLDGARLLRGRLAGLVSTESTWMGAILAGCRGLDPGLEARLTQAGARLEPTLLVRSLGYLRLGRMAKLGLGVGLVAAAAALVVVWCVPSLWPGPLLMFRLGALEARDDVERCGRLLSLSGLALERGVPEPEQRLELMRHMAECQLELGAPDEAQALLHHYSEQVRDQPDRYGDALLASAEFLLEHDHPGGVHQALDRLRGLALSTTQRLLALRLEGRLLATQGVAVTAHHPDQPALEGDPWRDLQVDIALALTELPELSPSQLGATPSDLFVMGEWSRALDLLDAVAHPPLDARQRWDHELLAVRSLVALGEPATASALLQHNCAGPALTHLVDVERLGALVELHRQLGEAGRAWALLSDATVGDQPQLALELLLLRAAYLVDEDRPLEADRLLSASPATPADGFEPLSRFGWLLAKARLGTGDEQGAVDALEPLLEAVSDDELARSMLEDLAIWSAQLKEPRRLGAMLGGVANPVLRRSALGQELALTILRAQANRETIAGDDPALVAVLELGTPEQMAEAVELVRVGALQAGTLASSLDALVALCKQLSVSRGERLGVTLAQAAMASDLADRAVSISRELALASSESSDIRSHAEGLELRSTVAQGELGLALKRYQAVLDAPTTFEPWVRHDLGRELIDALQDAQRPDKALVLARALRQAEDDGEYDLWGEAMACLVALEDERGLTEELADAEAALGVCESRIVFALAWAEREQMEVELPSPGAACTAGESSLEQRLEIAGLLDDAGRPGDALALLRSIDHGRLDAEQAALLDTALADWMAASGDLQGALALLEDSYRASSDGVIGMQLSDALLQLLALGDDPVRVVSTYLRFANDHPDVGGMPFWRGAALVLIRMGRSDLIEQLQGDEGWDRHVQREAARAELSGMMDQGGYEGAWRWLEGALGDASSEEVRLDLLQQAVVLSERSGAHGRLLGLLELMDSHTEPGSDLDQRIHLCRAGALETTGQSAAAAAILGQLLSEGLPPELRDDAVLAYGINLGRSQDADAIQSSLLALDAANLTSSQRESLRLRSAEQLLDRNEAAGALSLLEPFEGRQLDAEPGALLWELLARSFASTGAYSDALSLSDRYPAHGDPCAAWLSIVQHLPADSDPAVTARERALQGCAPGEISARQALPLARILAAQSVEQALVFLEQVRAGGERSPDELAQIDLRRAGLMAEAGQSQQARALYEEALGVAEDPMVIATGTVMLIRLVQHQSGVDAAAEVVAAVEQPLARVGDDLAARLEIVGEVVGALTALEAWDEAIAWQARTVEAFPRPDEQRGRALLCFVQLQLRAAARQSSEPDDAWREQLVEAKSLAATGSQLELELTVCELAWRVVRAEGDAGRITRTFDAALVVRGDGPALLDGVVDLLGAWGRESDARFVGRLRRERFGS